MIALILVWRLDNKFKKQGVIIEDQIVWTYMCTPD